jgi:hypothetical protein
MLRIRIMGLALIAVFALSVVAATAAQAEEGPFYKATGKRLAAGGKINISTSKAVSVGGFKLKSLGIAITCTTATISKGGNIKGSTGANDGTSEETLTFGGCTVEKNGEPCKVEGEKVTSKSLENSLIYEKETRKGKILVVFKPVTPPVFAVVKFEGAGCKVASINVEPATKGGGVIGEAWSGGKAIEVGKEPAEAKVGEVNFPATAIKEGFLEKEGALTKVAGGLIVTGGVAATLTGTESFELEGSPLWGVYTK